MQRSTANQIPSRARIAIGASLAVITALAACAASAAGASAPPTPPPASEPAGDLDAEREAIVAGVVQSGADQGFVFGRECVSGIVDRLPDPDVPLILADLQAELEDIDITLPDFDSLTIPDFTMPDLGSFTFPDIELPDFTLPDFGDLTIPDFTFPDFTLPDIDLPDLTRPDVGTAVGEISAEAEALGDELVRCLQGDADPALVDEAVAAIANNPDASELDAECAASVLATFPETLLQAIVDGGGEFDIDVDSLPPGVSEDDLTNSFLLFACVDLDAMSSNAVGNDASATTP